MRKDVINDNELPKEVQKEDIVVKTVEKNINNLDDDKPDRLELSLTKGQKRDLIKNAKDNYGLKPSALIRMLLKKEGII